MALHPGRSHWRIALFAMALAGSIAFFRWQERLPLDDPTGSSRKSGTGVYQTQSSSKHGTPGPHRTGVWEVLQNCTLMEDRLNDGDSFVVGHQGTGHTFRLYFADSPEKYRHKFNGQRIAEQGRYFGGLTEAETIAVGEDARDFSLALLRENTFTVITRWEPVFDSERFYAFVTVGQGDLAELLVRKGLARIYTKGENRPGGITTAKEKERLTGMERKAKSAQIGAWAER